MDKQKILELVEKTLRNEKQMLSRNMFHQATPAHSKKNRGVGITRKSKSPDKKAVKKTKLSRRINSKISQKKFRPTGSKQRK